MKRLKLGDSFDGHKTTKGFSVYDKIKMLASAGQTTTFKSYIEGVETLSLINLIRNEDKELGESYITYIIDQIIDRSL